MNVCAYNFKVEILCEQDIFRLEVSMYHVVLVDMLQDIDQLRCIYLRNTLTQVIYKGFIERRSYD